MPARPRVALVLLIALVLTAAPPLPAQGPPIQSTIFFRNPPPGAIPSFGLTDPIPIVVQVRSVAAGSTITTAGFSQTDFFRLLYFVRDSTGPSGPTAINTSGAAIHQHVQVGQCLFRNVGGTSVPQSPAIPVVPVEVLPGPPTPFFIEYFIPDARVFYPGLTRGGRYSAKVIFSFSSFSQADPNTLITNCENFSGPVLNVGGAGSSHQDFTIVSNALDFKIVVPLTFVGFLPPLGSEATCSTSPCLTTNFGNTIPVKFQLFDADNKVVDDAIATISVVQISGTPPATPPTDLGQGSQPTNTFKVSGDQYVFNLYTGVLARGIWQLKVSISDGTVHTAEIEVR
jgi:hypothetical protein